MFLTFSELSKYFFDISNMHACQQVSNGKTKFTMSAPRHTDALLFFSNTIGVCYQSNLPPMYVPQGALVYLPQGCQYIWENAPAKNTTFQENLLFEFTLRHIKTSLKDSQKKIFLCEHEGGDRLFFADNVTIISTHHQSLYKSLFLSLINTFNNEHSLPLSIYNAAYNIFNTVSMNCRLEEMNFKDISIIEKSIKCLEEDFSTKMSIKDIAADCHISVSYYERLFRNYIGLSPTEYRNIYRINYIKSLLHDPRITLDEISEKMGYCDSGYLCRLFKKKTGFTPKEYRNLYLSQIKGKQVDSNDIIR